MIGAASIKTVKDNNTVHAITITLLKTEHTTMCCRYFRGDSE